MPLQSLIAIFAIASLAAAEDVLTIGRCQDWQTLLAEPPVRLSDQPPYYLGIDRELACVGEAITIYAAFELSFEDGGRRIIRADQKPFGPFVIRIECPPGISHEGMSDNHQDLLPRATKGTGLLCWTQFLDRAGTWEIHLDDTDGHHIAKARVEVANAPIVRWTRLRPLNRTIEAVDLGQTAFAPLPIGPGIPAHAAPPKDDALWTVLPSEIRKHLAGRTDTRLPAAEPQEPNLPVRVRRGWIDLTLPTELCSDIITISDHLLVRWWRDGKPWEPTTVGVLPEKLSSLKEVPLNDDDQSRTHELRLALDWGDLPTGTPVSVQFLWSNEPVRNDEVQGYMAQYELTQDFDEITDHIFEPVLMSERIELIAP